MQEGGAAARRTGRAVLRRRAPPTHIRCLQAAARDAAIIYDSRAKFAAGDACRVRRMMPARYERRHKRCRNRVAIHASVQAAQARGTARYHATMPTLSRDVA